jgi:hypothetical protein
MKTLKKAQKGAAVPKKPASKTPISKKIGINPKAKIEVTSPMMSPKYGPPSGIKAKSGAKLKKK